MSESMKAFSFVMDNSQEISKQIVQNVFNLLEVKTQDEKLNEFIIAELNNFDFNRCENILINSVKQTINESLKPLENLNENNYEAVKNNLINNLRLLKIQDYNLDSNFKELSTKIATKFPLIGLSQEQFYAHFMSKAEIINNMINNYNNEVIDTLIKLSPQFIDEIKQSRSISNNSTNEISQNSQSEVQKTLSELTNSIDKKIEEVNSQNDYNQMMSDLEPRERKEPIPDGPKTPSASTYVGATNEDVEKLIKSNEYYSLLHGINRESFMQYNSFIQTGFNLITSDYYNRAASCNTLEERLNALQELKEIYDNFNGYITMEQSNQLRETIENMSKYLQKEQSQQMIDDIGIRYNGENSREVNSGRRM